MIELKYFKTYYMETTEINSISYKMQHIQTYFVSTSVYFYNLNVKTEQNAKSNGCSVLKGFPVNGSPIKEILGLSRCSKCIFIEVR